MDYTAWVESFTRELSALVGQAVGYLPRLLLAAVVMVAGWLIARLLRAFSVRLLLGLDRLWHRLISHKGLEQLQPHHPPAKIAGEILFWFVILFFVASAAAILGLGAFVNWLSRVAAYLPILLTGLLIILAGVVISALTRDLVHSAAQSAGIAQSEVLGRGAQAVVLLTATVIGVEQIGIDVTFLAVIVGVVLAATLGGVALAFGIGARAYMSNVIAGHYLRQSYQSGDRLRIRGFEGMIVELTPTKVILDTADGRVVVPARLFDEEVAVLPAAKDERGAD